MVGVVVNYRLLGASIAFIGKPPLCKFCLASYYIGSIVLEEYGNYAAERLIRGVFG